MALAFCGRGHKEDQITRAPVHLVAALLLPAALLAVYARAGRVTPPPSSLHCLRYALMESLSRSRSSLEASSSSSGVGPAPFLGAALSTEGS
jgi:hypothetical protein